MNVERLKNHAQELYDHMISVGYSQNYVQQIRRNVGLLVDNSEKWETYDEVIEDSRQHDTPPTANRRKPIIRLISRFDLEGKLPRDPNHPQDWSYRPNAYEKLNPEFKGLIDFYSSNVDRSKKKETTIINECHNVSSFLLGLQRMEIESLSSITQDIIVDAISDDEGLPTKSATYMQHILAVMRGSFGYSQDCKRISLILPVLRKRRKNIQFFTEEERSLMKEALHCYENSISLRDRAMGFLLYYNGLRVSDVSNLKLTDIDWENDEIHIQQQKTDVPLILPLTAAVGNAIFDYITIERGAADSDYIFLSLNYPFDKLQPGSVGVRMDAIYKEAGIRQNTGDRRGGHIFRHNYATSMLEQGVPIPIISRSMGHTSPDSTSGYLAADMVHLKAFALSIEAFPVRKGVFTSERV